jgi:hypothetical protein
MKQEEQKTSTSTKVAAVGIGAVLLAGVAGAGIGYLANPNDITVDQANALVQQAFQQGVDSVEPQIQVVTETIEVPVEVEKIIEVESGDLQSVLDFIYDEKGNLSFVTSGLKDSEVSEIVDRIVFVNEVKFLAAEEIKSIADKELHRYKVGKVTLDRNDIERLRVYDKSDELVLSKVRFKDNDATVEVKARFDHLRDRYEAVFSVEVRDGEVYRTTVESVKLI